METWMIWSAVLVFYLFGALATGSFISHRQFNGSTTESEREFCIVIGALFWPVYVFIIKPALWLGDKLAGK